MSILIPLIQTPFFHGQHNAKQPGHVEAFACATIPRGQALESSETPSSSMMPRYSSEGAFVNDFFHETDTTFNTDELRLPLSIMVGIVNARGPFPLAHYYYITSEPEKLH